MLYIWTCKTINTIKILKASTTPVPVSYRETVSQGLNVKITSSEEATSCLLWRRVLFLRSCWWSCARALEGRPLGLSENAFLHTTLHDLAKDTAETGIPSQGLAKSEYLQKSSEPTNKFSPAMSNLPLVPCSVFFTSDVVIVTSRNSNWIYFYSFNLLIWLFEHMEYSYSNFLMSLLILTATSVLHPMTDSPSSFWVVCYCFFACLMFFHWMSNPTLWILPCCVRDVFVFLLFFSFVLMCGYLDTVWYFWILLLL